eukprot:498314-Rhodomonas_salina.1
MGGWVALADCGPAAERSGDATVQIQGGASVRASNVTSSSGLGGRLTGRHGGADASSSEDGVGEQRCVSGVVVFRGLWRW